MSKDFEAIFKSLEPNKEGQNAQYIPRLRDADPDKFAVAVCTGKNLQLKHYILLVDGQQFRFGDVTTEASMQSAVKPILYALAAQRSGLSYVHNYIGSEPSGLAFNDLSLNKENKPHNPFINCKSNL